MVEVRPICAKTPGVPGHGDSETYRAQLVGNSIWNVELV